MPDEHTPKGRTDIIVGMHEADAVRDAEDRKQEREDRLDERKRAASTQRLLIGVIVSLVLVLAALVAGVVGVGITGHVPGVGDIKITSPMEPPNAP